MVFDTLMNLQFPTGLLVGWRWAGSVCGSKMSKIRCCDQGSASRAGFLTLGLSGTHARLVLKAPSIFPSVLGPSHGGLFLKGPWLRSVESLGSEATALVSLRLEDRIEALGVGAEIPPLRRKGTGNPRSAPVARGAASGALMGLDDIELQDPVGTRGLGSRLGILGSFFGEIGGLARRLQDLMDADDSRSRLDSFDPRGWMEDTG